MVSFMVIIVIDCFNETVNEPLAFRVSLLPAIEMKEEFTV